MNTTTIYAKTGIGVKYRINDYCVNSSWEEILYRRYPVVYV